MKMLRQLVWVFWCFPLLVHASISALDPSDPKYRWMDEQIEREFAPFADGITREMLDQTQSLSPCYLRYQVIDSKIIGPDGPAQEVLSTLVELYQVPNVEFIFLQADGVIKVKDSWIVKIDDKEFHPEVFPGPIFTGAKNKTCQRAILFHDWYFYTKKEHSLNWLNVSKTVDQLAGNIPWENKIPRAFWRGCPTGFQHDYSPEHWKETPRGQASYLSHLHPHLIDAAFCINDWNFIQQARIQEGIDISKPRASYEEHMKHKYQISIDGHTCTYPGLQWKLLSKCTVFLQQTNDIMWFYSQIHPWVHYIPVNEDLSDLIEKVLWAQSHDEECRRIASNSHQFAKEQLSPSVLCLYCYKVLQKYASLQRF